MNSKIKKGLGRGLSSLIGETKVETKTNRLSLSDIVPNKYQPRKIFDEEHHTNVKWVGGKSENKYDDDSDAYLNSLDKKEVQSKVGRYLNSAEKYLDNVCVGQFP